MWLIPLRKYQEENPKGVGLRVQNQEDMLWAVSVLCKLFPVIDLL